MLSHLIFWKSAIAVAPTPGGAVRTQSRFVPVSPATVARLRRIAAQNRRGQTAALGAGAGA